MKHAANLPHLLPTRRQLITASAASADATIVARIYPCSVVTRPDGLNWIERCSVTTFNANTHDITA